MIPQNVPLIDGNEEKYLLDCIRSGWISAQGKYVQLFEQNFAELCGVKHGIACCNGTAALHLALCAAGVGPGDEVIVPCFTLIADSNMVLLTGATPVFVDVDSSTWCLDPQLLQKAITPKTRAIIAVHMNGHPCGMDQINVLCSKRGITVIEDAAQAHGSTYKGKMTGSLGEIACFSFYASKTLTTGEGGMVLTNDPNIADNLRAYRSHFFPADNRYIHEHVAFNYRLTNLQAALGVAQCEGAPEKFRRKRTIFSRYVGNLVGVEGLTFQSFSSDVDPCPWNAVLVVDDNFGITRERLKEKLHAKGIQTREGFSSLHDQPAYSVKKAANYPSTDGTFPVTSYLSKRVLCLPSSLGISDSDIDYVSQAIVSAREN